MGGIHVAIGCREDFGILHASSCKSIVVDGLVHLATTLHNAGVVSFHAVEHVEDANVTLVCPIAFVAFVEVFDVPYLVVTNHGEAAGASPVPSERGGNSAEVMDVSQCGQRNLFLANHLTFASWQMSVSKELRLDVGIGTQSKTAIRACKIEIAPVNTDAVARLSEDRLLDSASLKVLRTILPFPCGYGWLLNFVDSHLWCGGEVELHVVLLSVGGTHLIGDVVDGGREQVVVVDDVRRSKHNVQLYRPASKGVVGIASQHINALLLCCHNLVVAFCNIAEDAKIDQSTTRLIITMYGKNVLSFLEQVCFLAVQTHNHTIHIIHNACGCFLSIDVYFASVVVGEDKVEVALQLAGSQVNCAANPYIIVLFRPRCAYVLVVVGTKGSFAALP